jgi:hypothetical protein
MGKLTNKRPKVKGLTEIFQVDRVKMFFKLWHFWSILSQNLPWSIRSVFAIPYNVHRYDPAGQRTHLVWILLPKGIALISLDFSEIKCPLE